MAANHVDLIRNLTLENSRLHDALQRAEKIHFEATGKSLSAQLGLGTGAATVTTQASIVTSQVPAPAIPFDLTPTVIPAAMQRLNKCKAPPLRSNPTNNRLGAHPLTDEQQQGVEEARIFYVALTRAQYELDVTQCRAAHVALNWR